MEEAKKNERNGEWKETVRPLCREIFIHGVQPRCCSFFLFFFYGYHEPLLPPVDGGLVLGAEGGGSRNVPSRSG